MNVDFHSLLAEETTREVFDIALVKSDFLEPDRKYSLYYYWPILISTYLYIIYFIRVDSDVNQTYSIRSTDKVNLEEFDLKSVLFRHMNKIKSANRNTANYRLYHALMEALITDEDAMDKEVADKVKDHKRKHDSDDAENDDDDEGPSAG
ncbi:hypothetical protein Tco_0182046 [Tanacetum coccineum]